MNCWALQQEEGRGKRNRDLGLSLDLLRCNTRERGRELNEEEGALFLVAIAASFDAWGPLGVFLR